jgi:inorganic pyrophosphatase
MALLDEGETDWKVLVVDVNDPLAPRLNDVEDVERHLPGLIRVSLRGLGVGSDDVVIGGKGRRR